MLKETISRLKSKTPKYFKKLRSIAIVIGISAGAIMTANGLFNLVLDEIFLKIVSYVVAVCVAIAGTATLTKEDKK